MRKISFIVFLIFFSFYFFTPTKKTFAKDCVIDYSPKALTEDSTVSLSIQNTEKDHTYWATISGPTGRRLYPKTGEDNSQQAGQGNQVLSWPVKLSDYGITPGTYKFKVNDPKTGALYCPGIEIEVKSTSPNCPAYIGTQPQDPTTQNDVILVFEKPPQGSISIQVDGSKNFSLSTPNKTINIGQYSSGSHYFEVRPITIPPASSLCYDRKYFTVTKGACSAEVVPKDFNPGDNGILKIRGSGIEQGKPYSFDFQGCETKCTNAQSSGLLEYQFNINELKCRQEGMHDIVIHSEGSSITGCRLSGPTICSTKLWTNQAFSQSTPTPPPPPCSEWEKITEKTIKLTQKQYEALSDEQKKDYKCAAISTGLGIPIKTEPADFIKSIFGILLGLSGGIALLLIIVSGYRLMASQGNPEKLQGAKEMLTSAIVGLLFIIFSFVILQVIGVDILKIPGFNP